MEAAPQFLEKVVVVEAAALLTKTLPLRDPTGERVEVEVLLDGRGNDEEIIFSDFFTCSSLFTTRWRLGAA